MSKRTDRSVNTLATGLPFFHSLRLAIIRDQVIRQQHPVFEDHPPFHQVIMCFPPRLLLRERLLQHLQIRHRIEPSVVQNLKTMGKSQLGEEALQRTLVLLDSSDATEGNSVRGRRR